jgi:hypothetical protein
MRPTIERAYWSRDFETEAQKACTKQERGNCDQGDKGQRAWMQTEARPRIASRVGAGSGRGGRSRRENSDGFIHDVGIPGLLA